MAIKYINVDELALPQKYMASGDTIALYRNGEQIVDLHGDSVVRYLKYNQDEIRLEMHIGEAEEDLPNQKIYELIFRNVKILSFELEGYGLDDLGRFDGFYVDREADTIKLEIGSSCNLLFTCSEVELTGI